MQKIKTATVTFHASHNYGSMLQAYALQHILKNELNVDNEIINFRSDKQKEFYPIPSTKNYSLKRRIVRWLLGYNDKPLLDKYNLFENFLKEKLILSQEFNNEDEVAEYAQQFDYLISGSDQIWNTFCYDFSWLFFLPFAKNNAIAYAPSMGPYGKSEIKEEHYSKINECLNNYKAISVREKGTAEAIKTISNKEVETYVDPTLLVKPEIWDEFSGNKPLIDGDYIFMYQPFIHEVFYKTSKEISKITGLPVVVSNQLPTWAELYNKIPFTTKIKTKLDCGPIEFLNLIKNAKFVISASFHAVVFSIIFNRPFFAINGNTDNRMSHLLEATGLLDYGAKAEDYSSVLTKVPEISFDKAKSYIDYERERGISFLRESLNI